MNAPRPPLTPFYAAGNRRPAIVMLPGRSAPKGARLVRLRVRDRPGSLAAITGHLAAHGVNVLSLEVLTRESGWAIDDFLLTGHRLDDALETLGPDASVLADRLEVDLVDPGLAMANACASVTAAGTAREACRQLVGSALELVFAEAGCVCIREGHSYLRPIASTVPELPPLEDGPSSLLRSSLFSGESLTADGRAPWAAARFREQLPGGAVLAVPGGSPPSLVLVLVREDDAPFVSAEVDRLSALVRVAVGTLHLHEQHHSARRGKAAISALV